jgi:prefoldin subunit 5
MENHLAPDVAKKLRDLNAAADLYREKIASIETQPAGQQFGLEMTQKLLREVEDKISTLEGQSA